MKKTHKKTHSTQIVATAATVAIVATMAIVAIKEIMAIKEIVAIKATEAIVANFKAIAASADNTTEGIKINRTIPTISIKVDQITTTSTDTVTTATSTAIKNRTAVRRKDK